MVDVHSIARLNVALEGRYRIDRELGEGGMATVYVADDLKHDRRVALKVIRPEVATLVGAERFLAEIRTTAKLQHPHLVPLFDSGEAGGHLFFTMPLVEGESLRDRLAREGPLPIEDALRIARECGEALEYAHSRNVVHRDIKPANILLSRDHALIADFGIAKAVQASGRGEEHLTATGVSIGTKGYMSPEQFSDPATPVDGRTDQYALGCVLYEMLSGERLFRGSTPQALLARQLEGAPTVSTVRPTVPAGIDDAIRKACHPNPADRYRDVGEFVEALRASDLAPTPGPPPRRRRVVPGLVSAVLVVLLGVVVWSALSGPARPMEPGLVILPLQNLSPDPDNAYFAAGIHEELQTQFAKLDGIRLIGGSSVVRYGDTEADLTEIANRLGVQFVLQGSVRSSGGDVRINARLFDAAREDQRWSGSYTRKLTDVFETQIQVAQSVIGELRGLLTSTELAELGGRPTEDSVAYAYYLRGHALASNIYGGNDQRAALAAYEEAVRLDPGFVDAWTRVVLARLRLAWLWGEPEQREAGREAMQRLEEIAPESTELRWARGLWYYFGVQQYGQAVRELEVVAERWPQNLDVLLYLGAAQRRMGRWDDGTDTWERVFRLDPGSASTASTLSQAYRTMRRFPEAEEYGWLSVTLGPEVAVHWWDLAAVYLFRGDTTRARVVVDSARTLAGREAIESGGWWFQWKVLTGDTADVFETYGEIYEADPRSLDGTWRRAWPLGLAAASLAGRTDLVHDFANRVRASAGEALRSTPAEAPLMESQLLTNLALAEAYLGNAEEAVRLAQESVTLMPVSRDAATGPITIRGLAQVLTVSGRHDEAVDQLRYLLAIESSINPGYLRIDPTWAPLRNHAGFQALLDEEP